MIRAKKTWLFYLRIAIAVALAVSLFYIFDFSTILKLFKKIDYAWAATTLSANILLFFTGSLSVWILLSVVSGIPFYKFIRHYSYAFTVGLFVPGQVGDASISLFLKKEGVPLTYGGLAYVLDKSISFLVFFIVASIGAGIFFPQINRGWFLFLPVICGLLLWGLYTLIFKFRYRYALLEKIYQVLLKLINALREYGNKWRIILLIIGFSIFKWLLVSFSYSTAFLAFGKVVPRPDIAVIPILSTFVGYIPVSVGGIGTVEYSAVYLFSLVEVESSIVVSVYIFMRLIQYLIGFMAFSIFGLLDIHSGQSSDNTAIL